MEDPDSRVIVHMVASLDGFIARRDGSVDWMDVTSEYPEGVTLAPEDVNAFLAAVDCYVMGSRTYETALRFETDGMGWAYGEKPTIVLTSRDLPSPHHSVEFYSGDLTELIDGRLRKSYRQIWVVGGSNLTTDCIRRGLVDEVHYAILPILIGEGIRFFEPVENDVNLQLCGSTCYQNGMVELRYRIPRISQGVSSKSVEA